MAPFGLGHKSDVRDQLPSFSRLLFCTVSVAYELLRERRALFVCRHRLALSHSFIPLLESLSAASAKSSHHDEEEEEQRTQQARPRPCEELSLPGTRRGSAEPC